MIHGNGFTLKSVGYGPPDLKALLQGQNLIGGPNP